MLLKYNSGTKDEQEEMREYVVTVHNIISQKVFIKLFRKIQFPHKFVNLFFMLLILRDKLTNLCGN